MNKIEEKTKKLEEKTEQQQQMNERLQIHIHYVQKRPAKLHSMFQTYVLEVLLNVLAIVPEMFREILGLLRELR